MDNGSRSAMWIGSREPPAAPIPSQHRGLVLEVNSFTLSVKPTVMSTD